MREIDKAEFDAARESLKEDPQKAIERVRGYVALYIGCPPEMLGDEPMSVKIQAEMERLRGRQKDVA